MDPVSALSLAANVCQFVDFCIQIVSKGNKLRKSTDGRLVEHADLYAASSRIKQLNDPLLEYTRQCSPPAEFLGSATNSEINKACTALNQVANELLYALNKLRTTAKGGKWASLRAAVKATLGKQKVERLKNELGIQQQRVDSALLSAIWLAFSLVIDRSVF